MGRNAIRLAHRHSYSRTNGCAKMRTTLPHAREVAPDGTCGLLYQSLVQISARHAATDRDAARQNVDSMEFAVDFMMQERVDSYFRIEPALEEVERSLGQIEEELEHVSDVSAHARLSPGWNLSKTAGMNSTARSANVPATPAQNQPGRLSQEHRRRGERHKHERGGHQRLRCLSTAGAGVRNPAR